ncbi:Flp pilus assembly protein CpaB [Pseudomonas sp. StFLB209]|uniref:Flp pilus assembly protein CpaB n=1 Tax=Pseudomonas sp. StFLB209 TaxID=1028989 RepID=UPI0004F8FF9B|nr:Flp pilus assembly protein CpaB [Pseudomonas sp. StFLB209]BAP41819.1 Flp pilus assembly protein CpaB [Pseudomonas sp. StFLB209]
MSSRVTLALAVLSLLGAILAGYLGVVISREPPAPAPAVVDTAQAPAAPVEALPPAPAATTTSAEEALRKNVVVLARDLPAYVPIQPEDLVIERLKVAPQGSFSTFEEVLGRNSWRPLAAGSWLNAASFEAGGGLARMIRPGERALAVAVDEVASAAGHLSPGDYVDVLLYLPQDTDNPLRSSQVVVPALRVLGVGALLGPALDGSPVQASGADIRVQQEQQRGNVRSVVLAVPAPLQDRLMLASQTGVLRLAVRSADERHLQQYWAADPGSQDVALRLDSTARSLTRFSQLTLAPAPRRDDAAAPRAVKAMEVIRGNQVTQPNP